ncbi:DUF1540 domain-containing protein [Clostridium sp. P21]|uniref:DUF1540 domain-containing protein n=1 Tax=Clostridium muellerianum TaxID=2716538 RepID=A0A7Y0EEY7_9CLOT|nr:DUF1540 domain-containing protein [Clostridium muellerianum]NMM62284.1 DUF1540 domain-containing protein [Clostridium muellerianum]
MSGKLSCSAGKCVNNINGLCSANNIHVVGSEIHSSKGTECETFMQRGFMNAMSNFTNMNLVGEFKQIFSRDSIEMSPEIKCEAENCVYNADRLCSASNVQVYGPDARSSGGTQCETFKEH